MVVRKPIWTSSSFLLYTGGFIVLFSATGALFYLATQYGQGALVAWTLIPLVVLVALAPGIALIVIGYVSVASGWLNIESVRFKTTAPETPREFNLLTACVILV